MAGRAALDAAATDTPVRGLCADSREARAGDLFFCLGGDAADGHDFAAAAVEAGAAAVVCGRDLGSGLGVPQVVVDDPRDALGRIACSFFDDPSAAMTTVGVTGTNGKTTTTWLVRGILEEWGQLVGLVGTLEYSLADAQEKTKILTRRFAKQQRTWLKRFMGVHWLQADHGDAVRLTDEAMGIVASI